MKTKLIKLKDKFILVSDQEIKEGDWVLDTMFNNILQPQSGVGEYYKKINEGKPTAKWYKIIAGITSLPTIDFSLLSKEDCKTIGWVDVEKLARDHAFNWYEKEDRLVGEQSFIEGLKTAQSFNDKMFSLKEMEKAIKLTIENCWVKKLVNTHHPDELLDEIEVGMTEEEIIQSIHSIFQTQQTEWDVEINKLNQITKISCVYKW